MEIDHYRFAEVTPSRFFFCLGFLSFMALAIRFMISISFFFLLKFNLPLTTIKILILCFRAGWAFAISQMAVFLIHNQVAALTIALVLVLGLELAEHLPKRTTAAYSTSDSQNQRLFNVSIFMEFVICFAAFFLSLLGFNLTKWAGFFADKIYTMTIFRFLFLAGTVIFLKTFWTLAQHFKTLLYLFRSYFTSLLSGKLKRRW